MVKDQISVTLEREIRKKVDAFGHSKYPGLSRSAVIEILLREALSAQPIAASDLSVAH
jgi:metal-responsive CopG/Arc/MetJ family transcriptional regulator